MNRIRAFWRRLSFRKKTLVGILVGIIVFSLIIQLIPYGHNHSNPPVLNEPNWDSPQTREHAVRSCFACHSNQVDWPWYSNIAPVSWVVQRGVEQGREALNYSEWEGNPDPGKGENPAELVRERAMPLCDYLWIHPSARLSTSEAQAFAQGLEATLGRPVTNSPVNERGKSLVRCIRVDLVRTVIPASLRTRGAIVAFVMGFVFGGITFTGSAALAYVIYRRRQGRIR